MSTTIKIRRRPAGDTTVPTLADGELFFHRNSLSLYIGDNGSNRLIAGGGNNFVWSIVVDEDGVHLDGDAEAPGASKVYGTDASGVKGWYAAGSGSGTVTSVDITQPAAGITATGGPVTTSGTITLALANDLAALEALTGTDTIYYRSGTSTWTAVTIGSGISFSGGTLSATGGSGTVTSVGLSLPSILSVTVSPVTSSGTLTAVLATQAANTIFAGPTSGGAATPTFRAQVVADLPALTGLTGADLAVADEVAGYDASATANRKFQLDRLLGMTRFSPGGRLTLTSGTPWLTSDTTGATTIYYTPAEHDLIMLWDGTRWVLRQFTETSLAVGSVTADLPYDIFAYDNSGTLALEKLAWAAPGTSRATDVTFQDGRLCKSGDKTRLYLGTFAPYSTTQVRVTSSSCRLWNMYNRALRPLYAGETTDSWNYTTATWREINSGSTTGTSRVECVVGYSIEATRAVHHAYCSNSSGANVGRGIGISDATANSAQITAAGAGSVGIGTTAHFLKFLPIGYVVLVALEISQATGTTTWYGDAGLTYQSTGLLVDFYA